MRLTLSQLKKVTDLELNPKETQIVRIPFLPTKELGGSELITPYILEVRYDVKQKEWITNLEL